jgi:hypothetical protein
MCWLELPIAVKVQRCQEPRGFLTVSGANRGNLSSCFLCNFAAPSALACLHLYT